MKPISFRKSVLGKWSSHPVEVATRTRWLAIATMLPVLFFVGILVNEVRNPSRWLSLWQNKVIWVDVALLLLSFTASILLTLALMARLNRWNSEFKKERPNYLGWIDPWMAIPMIALTVIAPILLAQFAGIATLGDWAFRVAAFLPLTGLIALTAAMPESRQTDAKSKRQTWLLVLAIVFFLGALLTTVHDLAAAAGNTGIATRLESMLPGYAGNAPPFSGLVGFGFASIVAYLAWRLWKRAPTKIEQTIQRHVSLGNLLEIRKDLFARAEEAESADSDESAAIDGDAIEGDTEQGTDRVDLALFGDEPSETQRAFRIAVAERYDRASRSGSGTAEADVCLVGSAGQGKTTSLIADSLASAMESGARTIWLLPTDLEPMAREALQKRFENRLQAMDAVWLIETSDLNVQLGIDWADGKAVLPSVLFADARELRQSVLQNTALDRHHRHSLLAAYGRIVVDDADAVFRGDPGVFEMLGEIRNCVGAYGYLTQVLLSLSAPPSGELSQAVGSGLDSKVLERPISL